MIASGLQSLESGPWPRTTFKAKAKAKDLDPKAKAKDLSHKAKAKDLSHKAKAKDLDFGLKDQGQGQGLTSLLSGIPLRRPDSLELAAWWTQKFWQFW